MNQNSPHNLLKNDTLLDILNTKLATIYFYKNIVVFEAKEGVTISYETSLPMLLKGLQVMKNRPLVYIANRIHSYSVNPTDFKYLESIPTLLGVGVVNYTEESKVNFNYERNFFKKPFRSFNSMEEAHQWAQTLLDNVKK